MLTKKKKEEKEEKEEEDDDEMGGALCPHGREEIRFCVFDGKT